MSRIGADHLEREAVVYVRQSTTQLRHNHGRCATSSRWATATAYAV